MIPWIASSVCRIKNNNWWLLFLCSVIILGLPTFGISFVVEPKSLSGQYLPFGNYAKAGKLGQGVSWSSNLDAELHLRKNLCREVPARILYQYRYDNNTERCYKLGETGPCGENMVFFGYQTNAVYGQCDCNYNDNGRPLVFDPDNNKCYFTFSRAYCKENEWLVYDKAWKPKCETNSCLEFYQNDNSVIPKQKNTKAVSVEFVPYKGSCVPLGEICDDKDPQWASLSYLRYEVQFVKGAYNARCAPSKYVLWRYPTPKLQCLPGSYLATASEGCSKPVLDM